MAKRRNRRPFEGDEGGSRAISHHNRCAMHSRQAGRNVHGNLVKGQPKREKSVNSIPAKFTTVLNPGQRCKNTIHALSFWVEMRLE